MLKAAVGYVRKNPDEVVRQAVSATGLAFGVPLATLRWFAGNLKGKKAPKWSASGSGSRRFPCPRMVAVTLTPDAAQRFEDLTRPNQPARRDPPRRRDQQRPGDQVGDQRRPSLHIHGRRRRGQRLRDAQRLADHLR